MRIRSINYLFPTTALLILGLATTGLPQAPAAGQQGPAAQGQQQDQQAPQGQGGGRGGRGGGGGQRGGGGGQRGGGRGGNAAPAQPTPRRADGKPILGSIPGQNAGRWSGGPTTLPQGQVDQVPFQPWARAVYDQRQIDQFEPHTRCKASGVSRQFSTPYGTEFVEIPDLKRMYIMDMGGPNSYRIIYMDGRPHPADLQPTNYGHSVGHWEGDTLVVETVGLNEKFWLDTRGTPHTKSLIFTERFTRSDMNTLQYQATIDDKGAYTKPWTTQVFTMRWGANQPAFEYICQDNNHGPELMLGSQTEIDNTRFYVP
jgi:hypothetical protein